MKNPAQVKADAINSALTTAQSGIYDLVRYINAVNGKGSHISGREHLAKYLF